MNEPTDIKEPLRQFSSKDFTANTDVSLKLSSGDLIPGNIVSMNDNFLEILTSNTENVRKVLVAYSHIVYVEQLKITTQTITTPPTV